MGSTRDRSKVDVPKGCMAVIVGAGGEQRQRFVIPVTYLKHHLFIELLKEAEEEYGFDHKGPITIPCRVSEFRNRTRSTGNMDTITATLATATIGVLGFDDFGSGIIN